MSAFHDNALMGASGQQGYKISRSVRLRSSASAYFNRTLTTPTNNKIWTWSGWVKRGKLGSAQAIIGTTDNNTASGNYGALRFNASDYLEYFEYASAYTLQISSNGVYRDPSAWYHIVVAIDTTQATAANRTKFYVNGVAVAMSLTTSPALNYNTFINSAVATYQGAYNNSGTGVLALFDGYMTEINFIDGQQLTPSSFGETDTTTGVWKPKKYTGTYGTNGFYLNFSDNSAATATTIGKDYSGNGNNWTPNNISVTAGVTYDSMLDVPTSYDDGTVYDRGNYPVINPLNNSGGTTIADGNLKTTWGSASSRSVLNTMAIPDSGKFYAEFVVGTLTSASVAASFGLATASVSRTSDGYGASGAWVYYASNQSYISRNGTSSAQIGSNQTFAAGGIVQVAVDRTNNQAWLGYNNVWVNATNGTDGNPSAGTNPTVSSLPADLFIIMGLYANSGNANFGQRPFTYTPPTGFVALNTQNLPTPTISNGANYMAATTYTGNASTQTISNAVNGISFQPDLVWTKSRGNAYSHDLYDSVRGVNKKLQSNQTAAETTVADSLTSFNSNGYTLGTQDNSNYTNGSAAVGWQWKANGSTVSNTSGSITSTVSAGATQGFSVVTYTGTGSSATVGHGLGVVPKMVIVKQRAGGGTSGVNDWVVSHANLTSGTYFIRLNTTAAQQNASTVFSAFPSSTVINIGNDSYVNASGGTYVAYCFAAVAGYSAFGSYTGNGSADGPFVYCGFRPRFILFKSSSAINSWAMYDTSRSTSNTSTARLYADTSAAETTGLQIDVLSNGFKWREAGGQGNDSGATYIFAAFAENPFKISLAR